MENLKQSFSQRLWGPWFKSFSQRPQGPWLKYFSRRLWGPWFNFSSKTVRHIAYIFDRLHRVLDLLRIYLKKALRSKATLPDAYYFDRPIKEKQQDLQTYTRSTNIYMYVSHFTLDLCVTLTLTYCPIFLFLNLDFNFDLGWYWPWTTDLFPCFKLCHSILHYL